MISNAITLIVAEAIISAWNTILTEKISSLERQVAFKRYFLRSEKDIEDALHIEEVFKDKLDFGKINKLKEAIKNMGN